jgi:hypothetical protein
MDIWLVHRIGKVGLNALKATIDEFGDKALTLINFLNN